MQFLTGDKSWIFPSSSSVADGVKDGILHKDVNRLNRYANKSNFEMSFDDEWMPVRRTLKSKEFSFMKKYTVFAQIIVFLIIVNMISVLSAEEGVDTNSKFNAAHIPMGLLGYEIGTYLIIEGQYNAPPRNKKSHTRLLYVDKVNDRKLDKPCAIFIENEPIDNLPDGTRCIFRGYESGCWVGTPNGVAKATGLSSQTFWHFEHKFIVTSVIIPDSLLFSKE